MEDALPLEEGEYYVHQIEGLTAVTANGERLGTVREGLVTGAHDVYVIDGAQGEILLPAIPDVILGVDLEAGTITVQIPDGLL
jgi:16S rRNA processing protein RimM